MATKSKRVAPKPGKKNSTLSAALKELGLALLSLLGRLTKTLAKGERYRGIVLGADGAPSHHLILLPGLFNGSQPDSLSWANGLGGDLPDRQEGSLLQAQNVDGAIAKTWHWLKEQRAGDPDYAYVQGFGNGRQLWSHRSSKYDARAVRRIPIR